MTHIEPYALEAQHRGAATLRRLTRWVLELPAPMFILLAAVVVLLRVGIGFYGNWHTVQNAHHFPVAYDYTSSGIVAGLVYRALDLNGLTWMLLTGAVVLAAAAAPVVVTWRRASDPDLWRLALLVMAGWQALPATSQLLGDYQCFILLFVSLALLARRWWAWTPLLLLAALSGPEPVALGFVCLLIGTLAEPLRPWRRKAVVGLVLALGWLAISSVWLAQSGAYSRRESLIHDVVPTLTISVVQGALGVYAWWGPWWILVGLALVMSRGWSRWALLLGAVIIPGLGTALTWDGTRVFVCVSAPIGLAIALSYLRDGSTPPPTPDPARSTSRPLQSAVALWLVALALMPALVSNFGPGFRSHWAGPAYQVAKHLGHPQGFIATLLRS